MIAPKFQTMTGLSTNELLNFKLKDIQFVEQYCEVLQQFSVRVYSEERPFSFDSAFYNFFTSKMLV